MKYFKKINEIIPQIIYKLGYKKHKMSSESSTAATNPVDILGSSIKLRCTCYHHDYSSKRNAYSDLLIGYEQSIYAINSSSQSKLRKGDIVIVRAKDYTREREYFYIGMIREKLETVLPNWADNGGKNWKYNYICDPITEILEKTDELDAETNQISAELGVKNFLFHARFCGDKMKNVLARLIQNGSIIIRGVISPQSEE